MTKEEIDALPDPQLYSRAQDAARQLGGEASARRVRLMCPEQVRMFLLQNGG